MWARATRSATSVLTASWQLNNINPHLRVGSRTRSKPPRGVRWATKVFSANLINKASVLKKLAVEDADEKKNKINA